MFQQICKKLNFPQESIAVFENAYATIMENPEAARAFEITCGVMLHPDNNAFDENAPIISEATGLHPYTVNMVLQLFCLEPLRKIYLEEGFSEEFFWELTQKMRKQLLSCMEEYQVWGNVYGLWEWVFHEWQCVRLGRLCFEPYPHFCDVSYKGVKKGDPAILIHIPGGEPLNMDAVMDSLKQGYEYFKDRFPGGVVPFFTGSWLLYPPYMESVFPKEGNVQKFASLFHILEQYVDDTYENFPSVFGCPFIGADFSKLPQKTTLQRNLLAFLKEGNPMGSAYGIFFYDENGIVAD